MEAKNKTKIKTIGSKKGLHLTPIKITIVSLGALVLMLTIGITPELMGNSVSKDSYLIKFNGNTGSGKMNDQRVTYGKSVQLKKNQFKLDGYTFNGWRVKRSDNNWMCYIDNSKTSFSWTNQSYCNKYGYVLYKDNVYIYNLVETGNVVYLYAEWKKS